jgi:hypothetical protein
MDIKLTLKLEQAVIEKAKFYARKQKTSLSRLIENYLQHLTSESGDDQEITPLVKSLSGILDLPPDFDHKKAYGEHLAKKY